MDAAALGRFPQRRLRRLRGQGWLRDLVAETHLGVEDLIWPVFVQAAAGRTLVPYMPGVERFGPDCLVDAVGAVAELGIGAVALFPEVDAGDKSQDCRAAIDPDNLICRSLRLLRRHFPDLGLICDVALDPYNSQGHDGLLLEGCVRNDETLEILVQQALVQAAAGADVQAPSDMMDGRVGAIRRALDQAGRTEQLILSYAAKYASALYGPFRGAIGSAPALVGDKKTYQMDPRNSAEALREVALDLKEGADIIMIKPGLPYLDILRLVKEHFAHPTCVYQVSGEYAQIQAAVLQGWVDERALVLELLTAFKRAGADAIMTYAAPQAARFLKGG